MASDNNSSNKSPIDFVDWDELKGKEARGMTDSVDLGEIQGIGRNYVITKKGRVSKDTFYVPKYLAERYDGKKVYFHVSESQKHEFVRTSPPTYDEYAARYGPASGSSNRSMRPDIETRVYVVDTTPVEVDPDTTTATVTTVTAVKEEEGPAAAASTKMEEEEEEPAVIDWDRVVHKNVRTMDGKPVGNIVAVLGDAIHVESQGSRSAYLIPKKEVGAFDGSEVVLKAPIADLGAYMRPG